MEKINMIFSSGFLFSQAFWSTLFAPFVDDQTPCSTEARRLKMLVDFMMKTFDWIALANILYTCNKSRDILQREGRRFGDQDYDLDDSDRREDLCVTTRADLLPPWSWAHAAAGDYRSQRFEHHLVPIYSCWPLFEILKLLPLRLPKIVEPAVLLSSPKGIVAVVSGYKDLRAWRAAAWRVVSMVLCVSELPTGTALHQALSWGRGPQEEIEYE